MRIVAGLEGDDLWMKVDVRINGTSIKYCMWLDTDEGVAECAFAVPTGYKAEDDTFKTPPLFTSDENNERIHTYMLHNFEVWRTDTEEMIAKV